MESKRAAYDALALQVQIRFSFVCSTSSSHHGGCRLILLLLLLQPLRGSAMSCGSSIPSYGPGTAGAEGNNFHTIFHF
jgi:hypothetical protein